MWKWFFHSLYYFLMPIELREHRYISNTEKVLSRVFNVIDDRIQHKKKKKKKKEPNKTIKQKMCFV